MNTARIISNLETLRNRTEDEETDGTREDYWETENMRAIIQKVKHAVKIRLTEQVLAGSIVLERVLKN